MAGAAARTRASSEVRGNSLETGAVVETVSMPGAVVREAFGAPDGETPLELRPVFIKPFLLCTRPCGVCGFGEDRTAAGYLFRGPGRLEPSPLADCYVEC